MQKANGHEAGTLGNNITGASPGDPDPYSDRTLGGTSTITFDDAHKYGNLAAKLTKSSGEAVFVEWDYTAVTTEYGRLYLYATANPGASYELVRFTDAGTRAGIIRVKTDGTVEVDDQGGTARGTSTNSIALNQFVRLEWKCVHSATAGVVEVKIFNNPDGTTETETLTSTGSFSTLTQGTKIRIGDVAGAATATTIWLDLLLVNDTGYPGPASGGGPTLRVNRGAMLW